MRLIPDCCTGCAYCVLTCPSQAIVTDGWARILPEKCTDCNQCVYACPNDCFVPDVPLEGRRDAVGEQYEVAVIGSGIGGLMAAAALAQAGRRVAVFEKLGFPGGRYTEIDYQGVPVTTAAWTSLGPKCHIGRFLTELGIGMTGATRDFRYVSLRDVGLSEQFSLRFPDGRHYRSLMDALDPDARRAWLRAVARGRKQLPNDISAHDFIRIFSDNPDLLAAVEAVAITASSVSSHDMPASEYIQITLDAREAGVDFAMPVGGVRGIVNALCEVLQTAGGDLFLGTPVKRVCISDGKTCGVELDGGQVVRTDVVLHNAGPARLIQLVGSDSFPPSYLNRIKALRPAHCAAVFFATRECLFEDAPMLITPGTQRVAGIFSPTVLDPSMGLDGLYLYDAFFRLSGQDRKAELALAMEDIRSLFPGLDGALVWHVPMFFTGSWPGTESSQTFGQTGDQRLAPATPIPGLYLVGMDVQGSGTAGDLIPVGVRRLLELLSCPFPADSGVS